jgi:hypothetical protein
MPAHAAPARGFALACLLATAPAWAALPLPSVATAPSSSVARPSLVLESGRNSTRQGDVTVHYNALPSLALSPAIAARHGITRSANRAVLNVAVVRGPRAAESVPVTARIDATARNASGEAQPLHLREVREGGAIYYLGEARIEESDTLDFDLRVHPEAGRTITLRYRQTFWPQGPEARP